MYPYILPCKVNMQYLLSLQVSRYGPLTLQSSAMDSHLDRTFTLSSVDGGKTLVKTANCWLRSTLNDVNTVENNI